MASRSYRARCRCLDSDLWAYVGLDEDGRPVTELDPAAAVVYWERPDTRIDSDDLDLGVVADVLGLSVDHVEGFYHGTAAHSLAEAKASCADTLTSAETVADFERGHAEGRRVRAALMG